MKDYVVVCTAEGDRIILELQSARFLINTADALVNTKSTEVLSDTCGYLAPLAQQPFVARAPAKPSSWRDIHALLGMFAHRALLSVQATYAAFQQTLADISKRGSTNAFDQAWNACAIDLVDTSRAHCWYITMK